MTQTSSHSSFRDAKADAHEVESGYASATQSEYSGSASTTLPMVSLTRAHIDHLNNQLESMHPMDILRFCKIMFPNLYQSTAFGLTGLATMDMLSKIQSENPESRPVELFFLDTLYHFKETYELVDQVKARYPNVPVHVFKPDGVETVQELEETYGTELWDVSEELYDWLVKVEPLQRAYTDLKVAAVLNGRRRSQGAARGSIPIIEMDDERGIVKINPMATWSFSQVKKYIDENKVPYNALLDKGYKSVGDWHSTSPVGEGEDERAGRWKGRAKTECGIHNKKSRYAQFLADMEGGKKQEDLNAASVALGQVSQPQMMTSLPTPPAVFLERKSRIVQQLAVPETEYTDASPKGSVDEGIRDFVDEINRADGFVTTSSCAGRVSVFLEGRRTANTEDGDGQVAGIGGKGAGGSWLFVSHDPIKPPVSQDDARWFSSIGFSGDQPAGVVRGEGAGDRRLIHFKFEPMILHVLTASLFHAQLLLRCGLQAGFRESGAGTIIPAPPDNSSMPIVAIRSMGLSFESLLGYEMDSGRHWLVSQLYLDTLEQIANERFQENTKRIERLRQAFRHALEAPQPRRNPEGKEWEDPIARRERLRAEGLKRKAALNADAEQRKEAVSADGEMSASLWDVGI
ncbi:methyltransferase TYW3-domain-containing protein [Stachybotrys elegans]|uniref:3'-phosphoadenylylsulfate reductase n=1 Tax=Stachybotrys elegans TaxID=80388 RepID=A0A8K0WQ81_9HYPO|nr:methyltransferase TYW3-domain-containing protein [Stachybotrys elegans]